MFQLSLPVILSWESFRQVLVSATLYYLIKVSHFYRQRRKRYGLLKELGIPGPKPNLLDGNWTEYHINSNKIEQDLRLFEKYGPVYGMYFGDEPTIMVADPELGKEIFIDKSDHFLERNEPQLDIPLTHGLLLARRPRWRFLRTKLAPLFAQFHRRDESNIGGQRILRESQRLLLKYLDEQSTTTTTTTGGCQAIDMLDLMRSLSLYVISEMAIKLPNVRVAERDSNVSELSEFISSGNGSLAEQVLKFPVLQSVISFVVRNFQLSSMMGKIYSGLGSSIMRSQLVSTGSHSKTSPSSTGTGNGLGQPRDVRDSGDELIIDRLVRLHKDGLISRYELLGTAEIILFAGFDTAATTLTFALWEIARHEEEIEPNRKQPGLQARLRNELERDGIESQLLADVVLETLRLYPAAPYIATRRATRTYWSPTCARLIPEGATVVYNIWLVHHNPQYWPEPMKFKPERFRQPDCPRQAPHFAPFGMGERRCLGYQLALLEIKLTLCEILKRYHLRLVSPKRMRVQAEGLVTIKPKEPVLIEFRKLIGPEQGSNEATIN